MKSMPKDDRGALGLRERKKARTRAEIRRAAFRLFRTRGYDATTVEQIAEAAEVSPSTFFRYFATKEDVLLRDERDAALIAAFQAQPPELPAIRALRNALHSAFTSIPPEELAEEREREALVFTIPEIQAALLLRFATMAQEVAELVAQRVGRSPADFAVRVFAGALLGSMMAIVIAAAEDPSRDYLNLVDEAMALLEAGLPL